MVKITFCVKNGNITKKLDHCAQKCARLQKPYECKSNIFVCCIGGSEGGWCRAHATPYGTQFFHFRIHFHRKAPTSEVHTPPNECMPPYGKSWIRHCVGLYYGAYQIVKSCKMEENFTCSLLLDPSWK